MHNLFGDTDAVDLRLDERGNACVTQLAHGETLASVLRQVNHDPDELLRQLASRLEAACLPAGERQQLLKQIHAGLASYTYLIDE